MNGIDILTLALAKSYTDEIVVGGGALKGKNCTISDISPITGGNRITFQWTLDDGTVKTDTLDIMDGEDGATPTIAISEITGGHRVTVTIDGTSESFDVMDGEKGDNAQVSSLPEASASEAGKIYQYVGETTASLINGYFYKCVEESGSYSWVAKSVQESGSGGTTDYSELTNKPQIAGTTLVGNKTLSDLGIASATDLDNKVDKVSGKGLSKNDYTDADKAEVAKVANKADAEDVIDGASYDSTNHMILFKNGTTTLFSLDAATFVKDGMVDNVEIDDGNLVITFNTDAGKQAISIPLTDIFDPTNYYDKNDVDGLLADKADKVASATNGDFAGLDANGNLTDSGKKASDFGTADEIADIVNVYGAKNLIPYPFWSNNQASPLYGVSYTINADGSITFSGTSTQVIWFGLCGRINYEYPLSLKAGKYIISCAGLPSEVSSYVGIFEKGNTAPLARATYTDPEGLLELETDKDVFVGFRIPTDFAIDTTIKPMLRMASVKDDTYVPYVPTNAKLNEEKMSYADNGVLGAKNLNSYPYQDTTRTTNGITFTDLGDGTVKANGTATADAYFSCHSRAQGENNDLIIPNGNYRLSGCPSGGSTSTYCVMAQRTYNGEVDLLGRDNGNGILFTANGDDFSANEVNKSKYQRTSTGVLFLMEKKLWH